MSDWMDSDSEDMSPLSTTSAGLGPKPYRPQRYLPSPRELDLYHEDATSRMHHPPPSNFSANANIPGSNANIPGSNANIPGSNANVPSSTTSLAMYPNPVESGQKYKRQLIRRVQQDSLQLVTMSSQAVTVRGPSGAYVVYHIEITSDYCKQKWVVCKRFSEFYRLRKRLLAQLTNHRRKDNCPSCGTVLHQLKSFDFPKRVDLFKEQGTLVATRMSGLEAFLVAVCEFLATGDSFEVCREINALRFAVKEFLQFPLEHEFQHVRAIRNLRYMDPRDIHVDSDACPICLCEWRELDGNRLVLSQCGHFFHEHCINEWYRTRFDCPICRALAGSTSEAQ